MFLNNIKNLFDDLYRYLYCYSNIISTITKWILKPMVSAQPMSGILSISGIKMKVGFLIRGSSSNGCDMKWRSIPSEPNMWKKVLRSFYQKSIKIEMVKLTDGNSTNIALKTITHLMNDWNRLMRII